MSVHKKTTHLSGRTQTEGWIMPTQTIILYQQAVVEPNAKLRGGGQAKPTRADRSPPNRLYYGS
jgi:hypothetical protein